MLKIFDTESKTKKEFKPLNEGKVKMYCCGPTVYDFLHIGNFRGAVFFNVVRNYLESLGYEVSYIYNFTDIDDKILARAVKENKKPIDIAETYIKEFKKDYETLKLRSHTKNPRATETLKEIKDLISSLIKKGHAYEIEGDVFFSVRSFKSYGRLSGRKPDDLLTGVRIEEDKRKKDPLDFALWKKAKPGETWHFESPWGKGRPGWHIECSAMIGKFLGDKIDIHGGGNDLCFPHHENEIAQSESSSGQKMVQFWMHNNMLELEGDKMSKSQGNIISMREFLSKNPPELFKFFILSGHYRSPLKYSKKTLSQALVSLAKIYSALNKAQSLKEKKGNSSERTKDFEKRVKELEKEVKIAFDDDFATPRIFACFFSLTSLFLKSLEDKDLSSKDKGFLSEIYLKFFSSFGSLLSLFEENPSQFLKELDLRLLKEKNIKKEDIESLVKKRTKARQDKDFEVADKIRKQLETKGIELRDTKEGSFWEVRK